MNDYCMLDENGVVIGVLHTTEDFQADGFVICSGATKTWVGTKKQNGTAWDEYVPPIRIVSKFEFLTRFTPAERVAILTAAKTDVEVEAYQQLASVADEVDLDNVATGAGLDLLVSKGLITAERKLEILG